MKRGLKEETYCTNEAANRRRDRVFREWLCVLLDCPFDSCYTTGELVRDARLEGKYGWEA